jgi:hypothetical protein
VSKEPSLCKGLEIMTTAAKLDANFKAFNRSGGRYDQPEWLAFAKSLITAEFYVAYRLYKDHQPFIPNDQPTPEGVTMRGPVMLNTEMGFAQVAVFSNTNSNALLRDMNNAIFVPSSYADLAEYATDKAREENVQGFLLNPDSEHRISIDDELYHALLDEYGR